MVVTLASFSMKPCCYARPSVAVEVGHVVAPQLVARKRSSTTLQQLRASDTESVDSMGMDGDKAGREYWDSLWSNDDLPPRIEIDAKHGANWIDRRFHNELDRVFSAQGRAVRSVLEVGCAKSRWLPHIQKQFGMEVTGLDYSEPGCDKARRLLAREDAEGEIVCADFFAPPERLVERFEAVVSFGVAEHFVDTSRCIRAFARFLKPGGVLFTSVPNMVGVIGSLQKFASGEIYEKHVPLTREQLRDAHEEAGLLVESSDYFLSMNTGVVALSADERGAAWLAKRVMFAGLGRLSRLVWRFEDRFALLPAVGPFAAFVNCVALRPT